MCRGVCTLGASAGLETRERARQRREGKFCEARVNIFPRGFTCGRRRGIFARWNDEIAGGAWLYQRRGVFLAVRVIGIVVILYYDRVILRGGLGDRVEENSLLDS